VAELVLIYPKAPFPTASAWKESGHHVLPGNLLGSKKGARAHSFEFPLVAGAEDPEGEKGLSLRME